jgi:hypothetical protein
LEVLLVDGSRLKGHGVDFRGRTIELRGPDDRSLKLNKTHVRGMRFISDENQAADPHEASWEQILKAPILGDAIILVQNGGLTHQEVVVTQIKGDEISIQLDDFQTEANREKLFGLLFYQRQDRCLPSSVGRLITVDGSQWQIRDLKREEDQLRFTSLSGVEHQLPWDKVESFDFGSGNIMFLTEISADRTQWSPYIGSLLSSEELAVVYAPRIDTSFQGQPLALELDGKLQTFAKGVAAQAKTEMIYTLPEGFKQFRATIGLSPQGSQNASLKFNLVGDQRVLAEEVLSEDQPTKEIVVDVSQVRRLRITVDFSEAGGWGDILHICQPRLLK